MQWKNKKVLVTGSEGMIGKELVEQLRELGANVLRVDKKLIHCFDITDKNVVEGLFFGDDIFAVFHLAGVKGNPRMTSERPVDFMGPMLQFDTNMILAAQSHNVKKFLYTSSIAVENPETDRFPAWAKQTAETLIKAMKVQYPKGTNYCVVRPCNVYGRYDNLEAKECMVISDLIRKGIKKGEVNVWDDGESERDFINAKDCARGMIQAMEEIPEQPVNLCSGKGVKIKEVAKIIADTLNVPLKFGKEMPWTSRVMDLNWNFKPKINIEEGIKDTVNFMKENYK